MDMDFVNNGLPSDISNYVKKVIKKRDNSHKLVYVLHNYDLAFSGGLLDVITELHNAGYEIELISKITRRDVDEIFLALFHQAKDGKITRPFAYRKQGSCLGENTDDPRELQEKHGA